MPATLNLRDMMAGATASHTPSRNGETDCRRVIQGNTGGALETGGPSPQSSNTVPVCSSRHTSSPSTIRRALTVYSFGDTDTL